MAAAAALLAGAVFFRFCVRGYSYIAHMLTFIAALLALHRYAPPRLWQAAAVLVSIGLFYFCIVEIPIIANSRTDEDAGRKYIVVLGAEVRGTRPRRRCTTASPAHASCCTSTRTASQSSPAGRATGRT